MRPRLLTTAGLFLWMFVFAAGASAQEQIQLYATIVDSTGAPASSVAPEDVQGDGERCRRQGAECRSPSSGQPRCRSCWTTAAAWARTTSTSCAPGCRACSKRCRLASKRRSSPLRRSLASSCAPRPIVRRCSPALTSSRPDTGAGRFVESLNEALQRNERDKADFFGIIVMLGTTMGDNRVPDRDINQIFERAQKKPTTVHVVMLSTGSQSASGGILQQEVGTRVAQMTNGRYESINAPSRIVTLLPEIGAPDREIQSRAEQAVPHHCRAPRRQVRRTVEDQHVRAQRQGGDQRHGRRYASR